MNEIDFYEQIGFDFGDNYEEKISDKYTKSIQIPQYEPNGKEVSILSLIDKTKTHQLISKIKNSSVSEEEKEFLIFSAYRHLVFNYSLIAEYYCNASKEMQELMEESALVIIDLRNAIANGYAKLNKNIEKIMLETGKLAKETYHNQKTPKEKKE